MKLPGLIDPHVHLREPGATHKEDWDTGTTAALAGGFTAVLAMPNTSPPVTDQDIFTQVSQVAAQKAHCDYAQYLVEKYTRRGYEPFVSTYDHLGQAYYRVRLGPVETLEDARALKAEVMDRYSLDAAWIDRQ